MAEGKLMTCLAGLVFFSACARQLAEWISVSVRNSVLSSVPFLKSASEMRRLFLLLLFVLFLLDSKYSGTSV